VEEFTETRLIPVVMITGLSDLEDKIRGIEAGADDFLNKPIFPVELFARVASLLRVKEYTTSWKPPTTSCAPWVEAWSRANPYTEGHCERLPNLPASSDASWVWAKKNNWRYVVAASCTT